MPQDQHTRRAALAHFVILCTLAVLALGVRLPRLGDIPRLTDETAEVAGALAIVGGARPIVDVDSYRGPFWSYLLAGVMQVTGVRPGVAEGFAAVLGALSVLATYVLGVVVAGRVAGVAAGLLMATSFSHVALNSHVAWSNNSTPLWTTLALAATYEGARPRRSPRRRALLMILAGTLWGLALHTHPSGLAPLLGAAVWFVAGDERRVMLRSAGPWLGAAALGIVILPLVVFNLRSGFESIEEATASSQPIAGGHGAPAIAGRLGELTMQLGRMAGGGPIPDEPVGDSSPAVYAAELARPFATSLFAALLVGALMVAAVRGPRFLAVIAATSALGLAAVTDGLTSFYDTRYLGFLMPVAYVAVGGAAAGLMSTTGPRRELITAALGVAVIYPLFALSAFYLREESHDRTNVPLQAASDWLAEATNTEGSYVFVDKGMRPIKLGGGGDPARAFEQLLRLRAVPHQLSDTDEIRWFLLNDPTTTFYLILADASAATLRSEFGLESRERFGGWEVLERHGTRIAMPPAGPPVPAPLAVVRRLIEDDAPGRHIFVDRDLQQDVPNDRERFGTVVSQQLALQGVDSTTADVDEIRWFFRQDSLTTFVVVAAPSTAEALADEARLRVRERAADWVVLERVGEPVSPTN